MSPAPKTHDTCLIGFDYEPKDKAARRYEPGDRVVPKLPKHVRERLLEQGVIEGPASEDAE